MTVWKPGLEVLRVSRCVLDYVTMDNAGGPHTCTAELKYAILRAGEGFRDSPLHDKGESPSDVANACQASHASPRQREAPRLG